MASGGGSTPLRERGLRCAPAAAVLVTGYVFRDGRYVPGRRFAIPMPAGGVYSAVFDLAKDDKALYGDTLVSVPSKEQMWSPMHGGRPTAQLRLRLGHPAIV